MLLPPAELAEFFGQSEVNLVIGNSPKLFPVRPGSMGRAIPGHVVEVVDDAGNVVPAATPGIVAVRRPDPVGPGALCRNKLTWLRVMLDRT